jgi:hypothetical protein
MCFENFPNGVDMHGSAPPRIKIAHSGGLAAIFMEVHVARYKWRMQWRSLTCWLVVLLGAAFVVAEVLPVPNRYVQYATAIEPIPGPARDENVTVDRATQARAALEVASFSSYLAWRVVDRVGPR